MAEKMVEKTANYSVAPSALCSAVPLDPKRVDKKVERKVVMMDLMTVEKTVARKADKKARM